jgi:hypothetical protein
VKDTAPVPDPPDVSSTTGVAADTVRTALLTDSSTWAAWVNVNATELLVAGPKTPLAALIAVTWHVVGATVVDRAEPETTQPLPVTENDTAPEPEPPEDSSSTGDAAETVRTAFDTTRGAWVACVNVNTTAGLVTGPKTPLAAFDAITEHEVGATVVDRAEPETTQPLPVTENDTAPEPEPPEDSSSTGFAADTVRTALLTDSGAWVRPPTTRGAEGSPCPIAFTARRRMEKDRDKSNPPIVRGLLVEAGASGTHGPSPTWYA